MSRMFGEDAAPELVPGAKKGAERQARNVANYIRQRRTIALCLSTQRVVYQ